MKDGLNMRMLHLNKYNEDLPPYDYLGRNYPTPQQQEVLLKKGLTLHDYRW